MHEELSIDVVRKDAALARLRLSDDQAEKTRLEFVKILGYVERLRELDLEGVAPMGSTVDSINQLADDQPGPMLSSDQLRAMLPESIRAEGGAFGSVPRVLGESGGGA